MAEIYRPAAEALTAPVFQSKAESILAAVTQAGRELVASRHVSEDTAACIRQPIMEDLQAVDRAWSGIHIT